MKISRDSPDGRNAFTGYGDGWVEVNGQRHASSLVVSADRLDASWPAPSLESLTAAHFEAIARMAPEIVLLGTGRTFRFPDPQVLAPLHAARIGIEVMDTQAACRTYDILLGEGRNVVAALILSPP
ncbi:MAG TPA: Mth938-like domain-containing protein [Usitatibacter sp.]|nr:Mth938-like domain-containing protein [Usitatibacter sp.]